jgi:hypothetical protein
MNNVVATAAPSAVLAAPGLTSRPRGERSFHLNASLRAHAWGTSISGVVEEFIPGEIVVRTGSQIPQDTVLQVEINACVVEGNVLLCSSRDDGYEIHIAINDVEAIGFRRTPRFLVELQARVFTSALDRPMEVMIVDISGDGLGLEGPVTLPVETAVAVESQSNIALGLVRYCQQQSEGVARIGIKVYHIIPKLARSGYLTNPKSASRLGAILSFGRSKK